MKYKGILPAQVRRSLGRQVSKVIKLLIVGFWWPPVALIVVAIYWFSVANKIPQPTTQAIENFGLYGDSFGRLTSLFTALGFGGLIITLLLQQRQIRMQEDAARIQRERDEKARYEDVLFRLLDTYRQTLSEVQVGEIRGRDVLRRALDRVDAGVLEDGIHTLPKDLSSKRDSGNLSHEDLLRIDYLHYRNFKIVSVEIQPQTRLVDTFEILLEHMCRGAPDHLLINAYRDLVFAQITFLESRYFFLVALSRVDRTRLRDLLARTGFLDRLSRSQLHRLHRDMYKEYWGQDVEQRERLPSIPMRPERIKEAFRAWRTAGGKPRSTYAPIGVRQSQSDASKLDGEESV